MEQDKLRLQRDLYYLLLNSSQLDKESLPTHLKKVLSLIVHLTEARVGYIEIRNNKRDLLWSTHICSAKKVKEIRNYISRSIIADSLKNNQTIFTPSAFEDKRYRRKESVIIQRIEATICQPFSDGLYSGVLYLAGNFDSEFQDRAQEHLSKTELFSRHIIPLLPKLTAGLRPPESMAILRKNHQLDAIAGSNAIFEQFLKEAMTIASIDVNVLLTGDTGTGKSHLAYCIHQNSQRKNAPFVRISCANLPETLVENELFGAEPGAHSGALKPITGKVESARGGTLFLDEIGELPCSIQGKLLMFIEQGVFFPLGSNKPRSADVRLITATNKDLQLAIKNGTFREDLYFRICVFPLHVPALRDRLSDIPELAIYLCKKRCLEFKVPELFLSPESIHYLLNLEFPGNIRQLDHILQQGILRASNENMHQIKPEHFKPKLHLSCSHESNGSYKDSRTNWEKYYLVSKLQEHNWNISKTARLIKLSRVQLHNLIKEHQLTRYLSNE